jgi:hypothetical protein
MHQERSNYPKFRAEDRTIRLSSLSDPKKNMPARAKALGAELVIRCTAGRGTSVVVRLPIQGCVVERMPASAEPMSQPD